MRQQEEEETERVAGRVTVNVPYERFLDCVHCGLCLSYCPTYAETGIEADSPRGRIHLLRALADGKIGYGSGVRDHLDLCLGCLACETACPSGVRYHEIIEAGRELIRSQSPVSLRQKAMEWALYDPSVLEKTVRPLRWARKLGMGGVARSVADKMPGGLGEMLDLLPEALPPEALRHQVPRVVHAVGEPKRRVGFLTGCVMSVFFTPTNLNTLKVLAHNGCEIHIPEGQGCCGALAIHSGDRDGGKALARQIIDLFHPLDLEAIIVNAAGCGSSMKEYGHLLADDPVYAQKATAFSSRVRDITEFLAALPLVYPEPRYEEALASSFAGAEPLVVAYHDACHLAHGQKVRSAPRKLLDEMPGIRLVELTEADWCCGSAGTYNITQPDMAARLLRRKVNHVLETGAQVVVTGNPGCSLQIARGLKEAGSSVRVMHTMDLMAAAYPESVPGLPEYPAPGPEGLARSLGARKQGTRAL